MAHVLYLKELPLIPRIMTEWAHSRTGIDINPGAKIGSHFFIDHGTGCVVGETGRDRLAREALPQRHTRRAIVHEGRAREDQKRAANVIRPLKTTSQFIRTHDVGGETVIGARSTIGGNVFLTQSVPPDSLVYYEATQIKIVSKRERRADGDGKF